MDTDETAFRSSLILVCIVCLVEWVDGWLAILHPFLTLSQLYQNDRKVIMKGCVQYYLTYGWKKNLSSAGLEPGTARSADQCLKYWRLM